MTKNETSATTPVTVYLIERNDNDGQGWYTDSSFRSLMTLPEARKLRTELKKIMRPSIKWGIRQINATPEGWTYGPLFTYEKATN